MRGILIMLMGYSPMARSMIRANARNAQQLLNEGQEPDGAPFTKSRIRYLKGVVAEGKWADEH